MLSNIQISDLPYTIMVKDVCRFDISMDDISLMQFAEALEHVIR
jgi:hypothetical protein